MEGPIRYATRLEGGEPLPMEALPWHVAAIDKVRDILIIPPHAETVTVRVPADRVPVLRTRTIGQVLGDQGAERQGTIAFVALYRRDGTVDKVRWISESGRSRWTGGFGQAPHHPPSLYPNELHALD